MAGGTETEARGHHRRIWGESEQKGFEKQRDLAHTWPVFHQES